MTVLYNLCFISRNITISHMDWHDFLRSIHFFFSFLFRILSLIEFEYSIRNSTDTIFKNVLRLMIGLSFLMEPVEDVYSQTPNILMHLLISVSTVYAFPKCLVHVELQLSVITGSQCNVLEELCRI